jgi:hypothetical protein
MGRCQHCGLGFKGPINLGMSDIGIIYCDRCGRSLVYKLYGSNYECVVKRPVVPWLLTKRERGRVEHSLRECPCRGVFRFDTEPRCARCHALIRIDPMWPVESPNGLSEERGDIVWCIGTSDREHSNFRWREVLRGVRDVAHYSIRRFNRKN